MDRVFAEPSLADVTPSQENRSPPESPQIEGSPLPCPANPNIPKPVPRAWLRSYKTREHTSAELRQRRQKRHAFKLYVGAVRADPEQLLRGQILISMEGPTDNQSECLEKCG
jgi:hypothetical protein